MQGDDSRGYLLDSHDYLLSFHRYEKLVRIGRRPAHDVTDTYVGLNVRKIKVILTGTLSKSCIIK